MYSSAANRTRSVSLMRLAINLGFSVGPAMGGFIAIHLGYHALFVLDTLTGFAAAGLLAWKLPKHRHVAKIHVADDRKIKIVPIAKAKTLSAYKDVTYLFFIVLVAAYAMLFFQAFSSIPQYFSKVCGFTEDTIGLLIALNGLLVVLIELPLMTILEKKSTASFRYIVWGVLFLPLGYLALAFGQGYMIAALAYTLMFTVSEMFTMPFMMNFSLSRPTNDRKGQYAALYSIAYGLALTAAPVVGLWLVDKLGFMYTFYCFIVACLFIALGFNFFRKRMLQTSDSIVEAP
jgi:predicted MFS family arabinose efflux permease